MHLRSLRPLSSDSARLAPYLNRRKVLSGALLPANSSRYWAPTWLRRRVLEFYPRIPSETQRETFVTRISDLAEFVRDYDVALRWSSIQRLIQREVGVIALLDAAGGVGEQDLCGLKALVGELHFDDEVFGSGGRVGRMIADLAESADPRFRLVFADVADLSKSLIDLSRLSILPTDHGDGALERRLDAMLVEELVLSLEYATCSDDERVEIKKVVRSPL